MPTSILLALYERNICTQFQPESLQFSILYYLTYSFFLQKSNSAKNHIYHYVILLHNRIQKKIASVLIMLFITSFILLLDFPGFKYHINSCHHFGIYYFPGVSHDTSIKNSSSSLIQFRRR